MQRVVVPEMVDTLPPGDPRLARSHRDLRLVNALLGNERWIVRQARRFPGAASRGIVELGAGEGRLLRRLARLGPATGIDLGPRPAGLPSAADWRQGDVISQAGQLGGGVLVANLVLHHFRDGALAAIGELAARFERLIIVEPYRSEEALWRGERLLPLMGEATRHDLPASIRAGFVEGELKTRLGLGPAWEISEQSIWRGGLRFLAARGGG